MKYILISFLVVILFLTGCGESPASRITPELDSRAPLDSPADRPRSDIAPLAPGNISYVWANSGEDKVTRRELRASRDPEAVYNAVWDGKTITLSGARNEVVSFNLILEAPSREAQQIEISLTSLNRPDGRAISTQLARGDQVFNYVDRHLELFYVRYLEIKGVSTDLFFSGYDYDERHLPARCRRPYDPETGEGRGDWEDRPCHNAFYPDIAVPLELHAPFSIPAGTNQSIWGDITIPKTASPGLYQGTLLIFESDILIWEIPLRLQVRDFTLPDLPSARTMLHICRECLAERYLGTAYPEPGTALYRQYTTLLERHFQLAHRHKVSLIDTYQPIQNLDEYWLGALTGELFTPEAGYDGIGVNVGNNVYAVGTYGSWPWQDEGRAAMWENSDRWVEWFQDQAFSTPTDCFLYLIDESDDYAQIQQWATWLEENPGPGNQLRSLATLDLPTAAEQTPALDIPASWAGIGDREDWVEPLRQYLGSPDHQVYLYNGSRPGTGSFAIEDEGVSLRALAWTQYKMNIDRWFYWNATYYENFQGNTGPTNVFQTAQTYGNRDGFDPVYGETGENYLNGDGVLMYPGTDTRYPEESYELLGPFASLRLKHWRRGIQDVDYLTLAAAIDPARTADIVEEMIPEVLWEYGVEDPADPTWVRTDISWSTDPDRWEEARSQLAEIIEKGQ